MGKGGGKVGTQIGPNRKCSQNLDFQTCSDRSRRAEHFLSRNLVSTTLLDKAPPSSICHIVVHDGAISYSLYLNRLMSESGHILPLNRANQELQKHAQTWSKICCARIVALVITDGI